MAVADSETLFAVLRLFVTSSYVLVSLSLLPSQSTCSIVYTLLCSYGLEQFKQFKQDLYDDFEKLTLDTYSKGNLYGLEKYWYVPVQ